MAFTVLTPSFPQVADETERAELDAQLVRLVDTLEEDLTVARATNIGEVLVEADTAIAESAPGSSLVAEARALFPTETDRISRELEPVRVQLTRAWEIASEREQEIIPALERAAQAAEDALGQLRSFDRDYDAVNEADRDLKALVERYHRSGDEGVLDLSPGSVVSSDFLKRQGIGNADEIYALANGQSGQAYAGTVDALSFPALLGLVRHLTGEVDEQLAVLRELADPAHGENVEDAE